MCKVKLGGAPTFLSACWVPPRQGKPFFGFADGGVEYLSDEFFRLYRAGLALHNGFLHLPGNVRRVQRPVVSIGNLTVGGSATVTFYWGQNSNNWSRAR